MLLVKRYMGLKQENADLKKAVAELVLEVQRYKKNTALILSEMFFIMFFNFIYQEICEYRISRE